VEPVCTDAVGADMKAVTVAPRVADSLRLEDREEPTQSPGDLLVETAMVGICGTDHEILDGELGRPPPGQERMVMGHEALGRVIQAPDAGGFATGDLVAPIVRRPDPVPCLNCAEGEWDMCRNGLFTEAGIRGLDGYASQRFAIPTEFAIKVDSGLADLGVLVEPASVVVKAWEHIIHIGSRAQWEPNRVLVTGAGPIGLLAALLATRHSDEVHVLDRVNNGPKPGLVEDLGAIYHSEDLAEIEKGVDLVVECTGDTELVGAVLGHTGPNGIVCVTGVTSAGRQMVTSDFARELVLENDTVFGTVNANRRHYEEAVRVLTETDHSWLERLVNRRVSLADWQEAYERQPDDVKTVLEFG
jgi:2-desacetyl-2-hydroxyethyl bacteriochlorophyllide A dehydrogenase